MNTALIIGDIQRGITGAYPFARQVLPPLTELLPRARAAGVLVVFVHLAFRANRADLPPGNELFSAFMRPVACRLGQLDRERAPSLCDGSWLASVASGPSMRPKNIMASTITKRWPIRSVLRSDQISTCKPPSTSRSTT
jgi:nicotinamidase-related amidase